MQLTNIEVKSLKPKPKPYKKFDGAGLYIEVMPSGKKFWRFRYRYDGKDKRLSFGEYGDHLISYLFQRKVLMNKSFLLVEGDARRSKCSKTLWYIDQTFS